MQAKEKKNNKPHEERGNQEQYEKSYSFNVQKLLLTFYHLAGGDKLFITTPKIYVFDLLIFVWWVSAGGKLKEHLGVNIWMLLKKKIADMQQAFPSRSARTHFLSFDWTFNNLYWL